MTYPNSVINRSGLRPGPHGFPGVGRPANDNIRTPRLPGRPPMPAPANDNWPKIPRRLLRYAPGGSLLPRFAGLALRGGARFVPVLGWAMLGFDLYLLYKQFLTGNTVWVHPSNYERWWVNSFPQYQDGRTYFDNPNASSAQQVQTVTNWNTQTSDMTPDSQYGMVEEQFRSSTYVYYRVSEIWRRVNGANAVPQEIPEVITVRKSVPAPRPAVAPEPFPGFYPPGAVPLWSPASPVMPGYYKAPYQIFPEWSDAGPRPYKRVATQPRYMRSRPPGRRTRERKLKINDSALGKFIERSVGNATEGLDWTNAMFNALPRWRIYQIYNAARKLEVRRENGVIVAGRLRYVNIPANELLMHVYNHYQEVDMYKFTENWIRMQNDDRVYAHWAREAAPNRLTTGPWDTAGQFFGNPLETPPEWNRYYPGVDDDFLNSQLQIIGSDALTIDEYKRIKERYDRFARANGYFTPKLGKA